MPNGTYIAARPDNRRRRLGRPLEVALGFSVARFAPITAAGRLVSAAGQTWLDAALLGSFAITTAYMLFAVAAAAAVARRAQVS